MRSMQPLIVNDLFASDLIAQSLYPSKKLSPSVLGSPLPSANPIPFSQKSLFNASFCMALCRCHCVRINEDEVSN